MMHSLVAKMSYPNKIPSNTRIEDIHKLYPDLRQSAKKVEFAIVLYLILKYKKKIK